VRNMSKVAEPGEACMVPVARRIPGLDPLSGNVFSKKSPNGTLSTKDSRKAAFGGFREGVTEI
jgi:hypothetical protein